MIGRWVWTTSLSLGLAIAAASCTGSSPGIPPSLATPEPSTAVRAPSPSPLKLTPTVQAANASLWSQVRQGRGYVILFRHALAPGTGDPANFRLGDCSTQRNLSAEGRQQAVRMGNALRQQNLKVARVLSSQWCRCLETARLMNLGPVEPLPFLNSFFQDRSTEQEQTDQLRQLILANRDNPGVVVIVTHQVNITAITGIVPPSGGAVVMRTSSPGQVERVGSLDAF